MHFCTVSDGALGFSQGGIGPAGLASEDLHVLDFTDFDRPRWHRSGSNGRQLFWQYQHMLYERASSIGATVSLQHDV